MAQTVNIPDDMLAAGDLVAVEFEIRPGANATGLDLAIHQVKQDLAQDPRFDYQGSDIVTRVDKSGLTGSVREVEYLIVYVQVRRSLRGARPQTQEAAIGVIALASLAAICVAAVVAWGAYLNYRTATIVQRTIETITQDPNLSPEQKTQIIKSVVPAPPSIGSGVAAAGASLGTALVIIGVLWALSLSSRRGDA
jgi:hypothetical protein